MIIGKHNKMTNIIEEAIKEIQKEQIILVRQVIPVSEMTATLNHWLDQQYKTTIHILNEANKKYKETL